MIVVSNGCVNIRGTGMEIVAETAAVLHEVRESLIEECGEDFANRMLVHIGRIAVLSDEELETLPDDWGDDIWRREIS